MTESSAYIIEAASGREREARTFTPRGSDTLTQPARSSDRAPKGRGLLHSPFKYIAAAISLGIAGFAAVAQLPPPPTPAHQKAASGPSGQDIPAAGTHPLTKEDADAWLDGFFPYALRRGDVPGAVIVIVKDGKVLTQRGYGYADVAKHKPVDPQTTMFRPGSVSKLFTWTAAMQMVEQGKLKLDADINTYLDFKIPPRDGKPITLRNLMTHTPGFEESIRGLITTGAAPRPLGELLRKWTPDRIFAPGDVPAYSNYGAALTGYLVERVSGEPFDDYVERHIFAPLGMTKASFRQPLPARLQPLMATGYQTASGKPAAFEIVGLAPAGSLAITGADMAPFMIAHLSQGGPLLKPATTQLMHTPQPSLLPGIDHMALGFYTEDQNGHRVIAHGGDTRMFHSNVWLFPNDNVGMFVSMNAAGRDGAVGPIRNSLIKEFADRYFPGPSPDGKVDAATAKQHAQMMEGYYLSSRRPQSSFLRTLAVLGEQQVVATKTGTLRLIPDRPIGGGQREWVEIAPFLWRASDSGALLAARAIDGKIDRFSSSPVSTALPAPWTMSMGWLSPALKAAFLIVLLTALAWPAGAIARKLYKAPLALKGREKLAFHLTRAASWVAVLTVVGWGYALTAGMADYSLVNGGWDGVILLLQIVTPIAFFGLLALAIWSLWLSWTGSRGWFAKLWWVAFLFAAVMVLWGAFVCHLLGFGHNY
jgi:CubicO group peptidase (beta-lactamase class C family)